MREREAGDGILHAGSTRMNHFIWIAGLNTQLTVQFGLLSGGTKSMDLSLIVIGLSLTMVLGAVQTIRKPFMYDGVMKF